MKGQLFSSDLVLSIFIFLIVFAFLSIFTANMVNNIHKDQISRDLELQVIRISDLFVKTSGKPENWEDINPDLVESIGLVNKENIIDEEKLSSFISMNYTKSKKILGLEDTDYFFRLENNTKGELGGEIRIVSKRLVIYDNSIALMEIVLWK